MRRSRFRRCQSTAVGASDRPHLGLPDELAHPFASPDFGSAVSRKSTRHAQPNMPSQPRPHRPAALDPAHHSHCPMHISQDMTAHLALIQLSQTLRLPIPFEQFEQLCVRRICRNARFVLGLSTLRMFNFQTRTSRTTAQGPCRGLPLRLVHAQGLVAQSRRQSIRCSSPTSSCTISCWPRTWWP